MKSKIFSLITLLIVTSCLVYSQKNNRTVNNVVTQPWWVVDRGGGKSTGGGLTLYASIGQPAVQKMSYLDTGMICESGFMPGLRTISGAYTAHEFSFADGWNMISVPLLVNDYSKTNPSSTVGGLEKIFFSKCCPC